MHKRKQMGNRRRPKLVTKAHGGIIYASEVLAEERRARINHIERVILIVKTSLGSVAHVSDDQAITDLLADLRHYCDYKGLTFRKLDADADALFEDDNAGQCEWPSPFRDLKDGAYLTVS
jgi:hypothetical protein